MSLQAFVRIALSIILLKVSYIEFQAQDWKIRFIGREIKHKAIDCLKQI